MVQLPFYRRFIKDFGSITAPIVKCMMKGAFEGTKVVQAAFEMIKHKLCQAPFLVLPNFKDLFELECDESEEGIAAVLAQYKRPIANFR